MVGGRWVFMGEICVAHWHKSLEQSAPDKYIGSMFAPLLRALVRRLPSQCAVCHAWPSTPLCEACVAFFAQPLPRCPRCALSTPGGVLCHACLQNPEPWDAALAAVSYGYPWARVVQDFKFHENPAWARSLALLMRSAPWVEPALEAADLVLPMPLSRQRMQGRGYNQAWLLAKALAPHKAQANWLLRLRDTPAQSGLPRRERLSNVAQAFAIDPLCQTRLQGRRVVLVDDVMTSGASLRAAAAPLRQAGVRHLTALVFARAEEDT
jgi:ComF family protein